MKGVQKNRIDIIRAITSPLGFFALSLLIVEAFLSTVLIFSDLDPQSKFIGMWVGASLFIIIVIAVALLVWCRPTNLMFGEQSHLDLLKAQHNWGTSDSPETKHEAEESSPSTPDVTSTIDS